MGVREGPPDWISIWADRARLRRMPLRCDQAHVTEGLWEVAEESAGRRVDLLRQQGGEELTAVNANLNRQSLGRHEGATSGVHLKLETAPP